MKNISTLFVSFFISINAQAVESEFNEEVSNILGEIILYEDRLFRFGEAGSPGKSEQHMIMIEAGFEKIKAKYPESAQVEFLWSVMTRSSFGSQSVEEFIDLVERCCNRSYIEAIDLYLGQDPKYNSGMTHKAKYIKNFLVERNKRNGIK